MCEISPSWFLNTLSNCLIEDMQSHISCICVIFSDVCFHMCSQIACLNRCKGKIVADVWNFSNMIEQMQSQISCICVIFSNVGFHMWSQIACLNRCKVTLVACVQRNPNVISHKSSKIACLNSHNSCRCAKFLHYDFQTPLKLPDWRYTIIQCDISCMCVILLNMYFHMCSQIACLNRCKVTIVACERFSEMLVFTCFHGSSTWTDSKSN